MDMRQHAQKENKDPSRRLATLRGTLREGAPWEEQTSENLEKLCAARPRRTKAVNNYKQKRIGAPNVKTLEKLQNRVKELQGECATLYRALAARADELALDRPVRSFATK